MTILKVKSTDKNIFNLTDQDALHIAGQLIYENMFSFRATILIGPEKFILAPAGVLNSHISICHNGKEYVSLKMNWKGQIVYNYPDGKYLVFRSSGFFLNKYHVEDQEGAVLLTLQPEFNWTKLDYNYTIHSELPEPDPLTTLISVYAANYFIASVSATI